MYRHILYVNFSTSELAEAAKKPLADLALWIVILGIIQTIVHQNDETGETIWQLAIPPHQNLGGIPAIGCDPIDLSTIFLEIARLQGKISNLESFKI